VLIFVCAIMQSAQRFYVQLYIFLHKILLKDESVSHLIMLLKATRYIKEDDYDDDAKGETPACFFNPIHKICNRLLPSRHNNIHFVSFFTYSHSIRWSMYSIRNGIYIRADFFSSLST
jgi:hypothetical protein